MANEMGLSVQDYELSKTLDSLLAENDVSRPLTDFKPQSYFTPNFADTPHVDLFVQISLNELETTVNQGSTTSNLSFMERKALKDLQQQTEIIIKPADKGGNIVLMNRSEYVAMCMSHLDDSTHYRTLPLDPTKNFIRELDTLLNDALTKQVINLDEFRFLLPHKNPTIATFYCLPKIHKRTWPPPGRPIVSGNNCLTQPLSKFIEKILHPMVLTLPSYLQDTKSTLLTLQDMTAPPYTQL
ncbi:Hypothetical predicted protein, partial [Pelobates cultripes]